jgi:glycosyltransferase involved in cell wall biosynthesis
MRILYISQYFKHPGEPGSTRSYWIARRLVDAGYDVTILAHRNTLLTQVRTTPRVETVSIDGIRVIYIRNAYSNEMGVAARARSFASFMMNATVRALREARFDLTIATSTPLTVAVPALLCKSLRGIPYIFEVRDLWPEAPIQLGAVRNHCIVRFLRWFERTTYRNAEHVVTLSPGMRKGVVNHLPISRTSMIPNMAKIDHFWPRAKDSELMDNLGLQPQSFKVIYFGQMGESNAIDYILEAASILSREVNDVEFLFLGHGKKLESLKRRASTDVPKNVRLFDRVPMRELSAVVNLCDVSLVTFSNIPILWTNSPNKLFDSLSAGKAIIVNSPGWTKELVQTNDCGLYVDPENAKDLADKILYLKENPAECERMARNARRLAETVYDKSILCDQFLEVVNDVCRRIQNGLNLTVSR